VAGKRVKLTYKQIVKTVLLDELPPYPVRSFTYRNEQVRLDQIQWEIVYNMIIRQEYRDVIGLETNGGTCSTIW
jgi:hypothetical protein